MLWFHTYGENFYSGEAVARERPSHTVASRCCLHMPGVNIARLTVTLFVPDVNRGSSHRHSNPINTQLIAKPPAEGKFGRHVRQEVA